MCSCFIFNDLLLINCYLIIIILLFFPRRGIYGPILVHNKAYIIIFIIIISKAYKCFINNIKIEKKL